MSIETIRAGIAIGIAGLLCACATTNGGDPVLGWNDNFGEANRHTMAAQIIDPHPVYDTALPAASGEHAAQATARYRTDKVKKPERPATSTIGGGSSSGSAGPQ
ncbi:MULTISPECIES: hypothetical protein [unclassified Sphingomonas]|uniref:hypothetical protein n=1 Tax=unclassified Sphingomonas TaxID=196159 RepID=UPI000927B204|nr:MULTISPECIES: hypothetical protein [unclassified Sphingomonas]MBN8848534.1 hypothetical protein [Sphingomonas sp.]OJV30687.1 MAG: hypothetical protein BGO24_08210 [Sphingomonas sp. 67-36]